MNEASGGELGMHLSPENPRLIVLDDGTHVETKSPVVELFVSAGVRYARTRPTGATADVIRTVRYEPGVRTWEGIVAHGTQVRVDGAVLVTPGFTHRFPADVVAFVELTDGAFVVAWRSTLPRERNLMAFERDGRERWLGQSTGVWSARRYDDPFFPNLLAVSSGDQETFVHPWDGHEIFGWHVK